VSHAVIDSIALTPTHDGETALVVELRFSGGGRSRVQIDPQSVHEVLVKAGAASASDLVGLPWSVVDIRETVFAGK
jgi:hypothetical protein